MKLGEYITILEKIKNSRHIVPVGLGKCGSWRGSYDELHFSPVKGISIHDMLANAKGALEKTFHGYKGGEYQMRLNTEIHIETDYGSWTDGVYAALFVYGLDGAIDVDGRTEDWLIRKAVSLITDGIV